MTVLFLPLVTIFAKLTVSIGMRGASAVMSENKAAESVCHKNCLQQPLAHGLAMMQREGTAASPSMHALICSLQDLLSAEEPTYTCRKDGASV